MHAYACTYDYVYIHIDIYSYIYKLLHLRVIFAPERVMNPFIQEI